ncbi:MAG: hypothetical protein RMY29_018030, partial [Nostoc sp. CreGUA01]
DTTQLRGNTTQLRGDTTLGVLGVLAVAYGKPQSFYDKLSKVSYSDSRLDAIRCRGAQLCAPTNSRILPN